MGYGGFFKSVVRVAASVVGGIACGPPCAAVGAAVATGATGGSFKEALLSGATTFIGSSITQGISNAAAETALSSQLANGTATKAIDAATGASVVLDGAGNVIAEGALAEAAIKGTGNLATSALGGFAEALQTPIGDLPIIGSISDGIGSIFEASNFGDVGGVIRTGFDFLSENGSALLGEGGLGFDVTPLAINTAGDLAAAGIGSLATLTLDQALNADLEGLDEVLGQKFGPEQIQTLRDEARNRLSQGVFDRLTGEGTTLDNPFLRPGAGTPEEQEAQRQAQEEEFRKVIASGIERENIGLGRNITEQQFNQVFDNPDLGDIILADELDLRKQAFNQDIGAAFPGQAFGEVDDDIIQSIVDERQLPGQKQIGALEARGNFNPIGGQTANAFLASQRPAATERVREIGAGVRTANQRSVDEIRDRASRDVRGFRLGDDLFDVAPFSQERSDVIAEREGTLGEDIRTAIGQEPIFDITGALRTGGRAQGVVSGSPNQSLLDSIAQRELGSTANRRRGLGSRGSGVF